MLRLLLRLTIGALFVGHGTQKLFGWFGGNGLAATARTFESMGMRPGREHALAAGVAEAGGGALLAAGVATPVAAATLTAAMLTAIHRVHAKNGPWLTNGGYEYNLVLIAAVLALAETGPGALALGKGRSGPWWALAALAAAGAGAVGANWIAECNAEAPPEALDRHRGRQPRGRGVGRGRADWWRVSLKLTHHGPAQPAWPRA
jgi:putative oxidoreductase